MIEVKDVYYLVHGKILHDEQRVNLAIAHLLFVEYGLFQSRKKQDSIHHFRSLMGKPDGTVQYLVKKWIRPKTKCYGI